MSNAKYVRNFLLTCPYIEASELDMHVNFIGETPVSYSIEPEPTTIVIKRYKDGASQRRFSFTLLSCRDVINDDDRIQNDQNFEKLSDWIDMIKQTRNFPEMQEGRIIKSMEATGNVYLSERADNNDFATYAMQFELIYYQNGGIF